MRRDVDDAINRIAARQHGVFHRDQALDVGATPQLISRRLAAGLWEARSPAVYGLPSHPRTWHQRLLVALLDGGPLAVASHRSAAVLHRLEGFPRAPIEVLVPHGSHHAVAGTATVHQSRRISAVDLSTAADVPVTSVERTLVDLPAVVPIGRVARALDGAIVARATSLSLVRSRFLAVAGPGRPGTADMARLLSERGDGSAVPESELERKILEVLERFGVPAPIVQYRPPWRTVEVGRVDLAWPAHRYVLEGDSRRWHAQLEAMARDRRRDRLAARMGWLVGRCVYEDVLQRPRELADDVRAALEARRLAA